MSDDKNARDRNGAPNQKIQAYPDEENLLEKEVLRKKPTITKIANRVVYSKENCTVIK